MSSQKSTATLRAESGQAKAPQRARGHARVAALLEAAGTEFCRQVGYDAANATAIAIPRGRIDWLAGYQFFPTKDRIAGALLESYLEHTRETFHKLREAAPSSGGASVLASRLTRTFVKFRATHPAFAVLVETYSYALPGTMSIRESLRREIESVLAEVAPHLAPAEIAVRAAVIQQIMKAAVAVNGDTSMASRKAVMDELESLMRHYLQDAIQRANLDTLTSS